MSEPLGIIQPQHREEIDTQGYTVIEALFSRPEMDDLAGLIETHQLRHNERLEAGATGGISRANEITFTDHIAEADPAIMAFVKRPEFIEIATSLLGPDVDLYWNQSVYKGGGGGKQFPWHQDDGYMEVEPTPYLTLWLAVNDVTVENGCVWFLPGSHKNGTAPHVDTPDGRSCYSLDDPYQGVPAPLSAGSIAAFWSQTMHKSGLNVSEGMRKAYVIQYAKAGLRKKESGEPVPRLTPIAREGSSVS